MDRRDGPPDPELVQRYREAYGDDAGPFLRQIAAGWEQAGSRPHWGTGEHSSDPADGVVAARLFSGR